MLAQIGLGYMVVFLLLGRSPRVQLAAALAILAGYWLLFAAYPLPSPGFDRKALGIPENVPALPGFFAHWDMNTNAAAAFDRWFLNLFPRPAGRSVPVQRGGLRDAQLHSLDRHDDLRPAGGRARAERAFRDGEASGRWSWPGRSAWWSATVLDVTVCPIVKRIWTPSWTIYSTGWACWQLAFFYGVIDVAGYRRWAFPLVVVGVNSIAMYVMSQLLKPFVARHAPDSPRAAYLRRHLWADRRQRVRAVRVLADLPVDVPVQDIREDLKRDGERFQRKASRDRFRRGRP